MNENHIIFFFFGTFTISIAEDVEEKGEKVFVEDLLNTVEAGFSGLNGSTAAAWTNGSATCFVDGLALKFSDGSEWVTEPIEAGPIANGDTYTCTSMTASLTAMTNITFTMSEDKLVSIALSGANPSLNALYGEYSAPTE